MNKRAKTFLMISVVLNVLLLGIVMGEASSYFADSFVLKSILHPGSVVCATKSPEAMLPEAKRKLLESTLTPALNQMKLRHEQISQAKQEALRVIKAEPFDEKAYRVQIQRILDLNARNKHDVTDAVVKLARQFTPAERAILAEIIAASSPSTQSK